MAKKKAEPNKIAIVGLIYDGTEAVFKDETFQIWAMNSAFRIFPKIDILFDMHDWDSSEYYAYYDHELLHEKHSFKIVKPSAVSSFNDIMVYPWQLISQKLPYFSACSITYMLSMALVLYPGIPIYVFGFNNGELREHPDMLESFYYLLGYAKGYGQAVHIVTSHTLDDATSHYGIDMKLKDVDSFSKSGFLDSYKIKGEVKG